MRRAAVLLPLFSIRSGSGFGLGEIPDIPRFARWARRAGFQVLQLLPVGEICAGETSPYAAASAFALDPVYLGLDECEDFCAVGGRPALSPEDRAELEALAGAPAVAWDRVRALKRRATDLAFLRFVRDEWTTSSARARDLVRFREEHDAWLADSALFSALHDRFGTSWQEWPPGLRDRTPAALAAARDEHAQDILHKVWLQWQLDEQWRRARAAAQAAGVALMGDLPFMVSADSADVWARRHDFRLDLRAGTPPDDFSAEGQDWGLPVCDWERMRRSGFAWMRARATRAAALYSLNRVDHVIGLYRTYYRNGSSAEPGALGDGLPSRAPEARFTPADEAEQLLLGETLLRIFAEAGEIVAEDLGMVPEYLRASLERLGIPGYKVLRWEKEEVDGDGGKETVYRDPAQWAVTSVAASGTHDTETTAQWYDLLSTAERTALGSLPGLESLAARERFDDVVRDAFLRVLYAAPSDLVAVPLQDAFGTRERINLPGTVNGANWTFRMPMDLETLARDRATTERLFRLASETGR